VSPAGSRCVLVYAVAPDRLTARQANDALNEYVEDTRRGVPVLHDHFAGKPHGGFAVLYVDSDEQQDLLEDPGPLAEWQVTAHPLVYSLTPVGFAALLDFSLRVYGKTSLEELRAAEEPDPRYWWREEEPAE
jgi:hypothetical protein